MNPIENIKAELEKTANILRNAGTGESEKKINVTFGSDSSAIRIDSTKFKKEDGSIFFSEKGLSEEKGRLLVKSQISNSITANEKIKIAADKDLKNLFQNVIAKNAVNSVKENWTGFSEDVDNFLNNLEVKEESNTLDKVTNDWFFNKSNPYSDKVNPILDKLSNDLKDTSINRISKAKEAFEELKKILEYFEEEKGDPTKEGEGESKEGEGESNEGEGDTNEEGKEESNEEGEEESNEEGKEESSTKEKGKGEAKVKKESGKPKPSSSSSDDKHISKQPSSIFDSLIEEPQADDTLEKKEEDEPTIKEGYDPFPSKTVLIQTKKINGADKLYNEIVKSNRRQIEEIKKTFSFRNVNPDRYSYGKETGYIDQNGLHKFSMGRIDLFAEKELVSRKKVTIGILLDQSGSMEINKGRDEAARKVVVCLVEALKTLKGIDLIVYGHTGDKTGTHDLNMIPYIDKAAGFELTENLSKSKGIEENLDGYAMRYLSERMLATNPVNENSKHLMLVITDGCPAAWGYYDTVGRDHTSTVTKEIIKNKQKVFAIGIKQAFNQATGEKLYGKNNFVIIKDIESSLNIFCQQARKIFQ